MVGWVKVRHPAYKNTCAADRTGSVSEEMEKEVQQGTDWATFSCKTTIQKVSGEPLAWHRFFYRLDVKSCLEAVLPEANEEGRCVCWGLSCSLYIQSSNQ